MQKSLDVGLIRLSAGPKGLVRIAHSSQPGVAVLIEETRLERWSLRILRDELFSNNPRKTAKAVG